MSETPSLPSRLATRLNPARALAALRIRGQVTLALGFATALLVGLGGGMFVSLRANTNTLEKLGRARFPAVQAISSYQEATLAMQGALNGLINPRNEEDERQVFFTELDQAQREAEAARAAFEALPEDEDVKDAWASTGPRWQEWKAAVALIIAKQRQRDALLAEGTSGGARVMEIDLEAGKAVAAAREARRSLAQVVVGLVEYTRDQSGAETELAMVRARRTNYASGVAVGVAAVALALLALL
ncbi:MAG TPA: hypothetical protein VF400_14880, partial [Anaeromyxobacteraceae bacterium]